MYERWWIFHQTVYVSIISIQPEKNPLKTQTHFTKTNKNKNKTYFFLMD